MPMTVGISGGTGSGKTTLARNLVSSIGAENAVFLQQDSYYRNFAEMPLDVRRQVNFDHPEALDMDLMYRHLDELRSGRPIDVPLYNFVTHLRQPGAVHMEPRPIIIVEGILIFADPRIRRLFDMKIFVECGDDIRFIRRLERDIRERGRSLESVIAQYLGTVRPMHLEYVLPSRCCADLIVPEGGLNEVVVDLIASKIRAVVHSEPRP
jgi:uridine kinase